MKKKLLLGTIFILTMIFSVFALVACDATGTTSGGSLGGGSSGGGSSSGGSSSSWTYAFSNGTIIDVNPYKMLGSISIPSKINGETVTAIGSEAFYGCRNLTSITIPSSVTSIGYGAFERCISLEEITIPFVGAKAGVTSSDTSQYPFGYIFGISTTGATATTQYYYGSSTSSTTSSTYYIPTSLKKVTVTGGNILRGAFYDCDSLTSITIPNSVTSIGRHAFYECSSLTIYCEATSKPSGWDSYWNSYSRPVVWGYKG